eukprot:6205733-Pleurochrysis_carterae.AAC.2
MGYKYPYILYQYWSQIPNKPRPQKPLFATRGVICPTCKVVWGYPPLRGIESRSTDGQPTLTKD